MIDHLIAIGLAYVIDRVFGDPPHWPHPIKLFSRMIHSFDRRANHGNYKRLKGEGNELWIV